MVPSLKGRRLRYDRERRAYLRNRAAEAEAGQKAERALHQRDRLPGAARVRRPSHDDAAPGLREREASGKADSARAGDKDAGGVRQGL